MTFAGDDRGVSTVVGAILIFGFLIILLSVYQAQVVPQQNQAAEFDHSLAVQTDMLELRNAILVADAEGRTTFAAVDLGPQYPSRFLGINPGPPSGSLRTGQAETVTITDGAGSPVTGICPSGGAIQSRPLRFTPGYNEYENAPTIVYENTVLYLAFDNENILLTDELLVQGSTVNVNPLNTTFDESGTATIPVEPKPGLQRSREIQDAQVTYPTGLSESTWESLLSEDVPPENVTVTNGQLTIDTGGKIKVTCSPLGLNEAPAGGSRTGAGVDINPAGPNDVELRNFNRPSNDVVEASFNNTGNQDANVTEARVSFYNNPSDTGGDIGPIDLINQDGTTVVQMEVLGPRKVLDPEINLPGNGTITTLRFENPGGEKFSQDDFFVVQFVFSNGQTGTYFIDVPA